MARASAAKSRIYVDEFNWSGLTNSIDLAIDVDDPDVTCFNDAAYTFVEGKYNSAIGLNGFFDSVGVASAYDAKMFAALADDVEHLVGVYLGNQALYATKGYEIKGLLAGQPRRADIAGAVLLNVQWTTTGPVVRSTVLCNGAVTATGDVANSKQNIGASSAGVTYVGILRVLSVTGTGSITVKVQEADTENGEYSDLFAFTAKTAVGSQRMTTDNATKAWKKVNVSAFSGFSSVTILVVIGEEKDS